MKLSTKGRYGARAMLDLAIHNSSAPVLLKDIAKRQDIAIRYLENIMLSLVKAGLVRSTRGKKGGFELAGSVSSIKLIDIVKVLEGPLSFVNCIDNPGCCRRVSQCVTRRIWGRVRIAIIRELSSVTLKDMVKMYKAENCKRPDGMYYI